MLGYEQRHEAGPRGSHRWAASRIVTVLEEMRHLLERTMIAEDVFSQYYAHHLNDTYDVVDRRWLHCSARLSFWQSNRASGWPGAGPGMETRWFAKIVLYLSDFCNLRIPNHRAWFCHKFGASADSGGQTPPPV